MSDYARELGKQLGKQGTDAADALKRYMPKPVKVERVRDVFDPLVPFEMEFNTTKNETTCILNLYFNGPPPSNCCSNNLCSVCEVFADGEEVIQLSRDYIPDSLVVFIEGIKRTTFEQTSPATGVLTITIPVEVGTIVRVCYVYATAFVNGGDGGTGVGGGGGGINPPPYVPPDDDVLPPADDDVPDPTTTNTYYVDSVNGVDTNSGTPLSAAWKTLQHAANTAPSGSQIWVRYGSYFGMNVTRPNLVFERYAGDDRPLINQATQFVVNISAPTVLRGFQVQGANKQWGAGIRVGSTAATTKIDDCVIKNCRSFGIYLQNAGNVRLTNNDISYCDSGIQMTGNGYNVISDSNTIHHLSTMVVDVGDPTRPGTGDRGANAYIFTNTTGPTIVQNDLYYGLRAYSTQFGTDGGAWEFYNCANITLRYNKMYDVQNMGETGGNTPGCSNLDIYRNIVYAGPTINVPGPRHGIILRSADDSVVSHNVFDGTTVFALDISDSGAFSGTINGLIVKNNLCRASDKMLSIDNFPLNSAGVEIDNNLYYHTGGGAIAYVQGNGNTTSIATVRTWTGYELNGVQGNPLLNTDYTLQTGSPAIDAGEIGITGAPSYLGAAPDIGRFEKE